MKKMLMALMFVAGVASAQIPDQQAAAASTAGQSATFTADTKGDVEGAYGFSGMGARRLYAGLPLRYFTTAEYIKVSAGITWVNRHDQVWEAGEGAALISVDLIQAGQKIWAGTHTRAADWTKRWKVWASAGVVLPRTKLTDGSSWVLGERTMIAGQLEARILP